jgi:hypothetical protein
VKTSAPSRPPLSPASWLLLAGLALAAAAGRWLTRAELVYNWDSVHYILAQDRYDLLAHQPHPPGSAYYILMARAARWLTGDPHAALLLLSSLFGAGLVLALFFLGRDLGGDAAGWIAAAAGASAPLFWFYGSVGLNYGPAGTLSGLVALGCVRLCLGADPLRSGLLAGSALGMLGGFRPTDVVFLGPAYLWALACCLRPQNEQGISLRLRVAGVSLFLAAGLTLGWLVPNVLNAGGIGPYLQSIRGQDHLLNRSSVFLSGWPAWNEAIISHQRSLESALGLLWVPVLVAGVQAFRRSGVQAPDTSTPQHPNTPTPQPPGAERLILLGLLIVLPASFFYLLGHFNAPGYALTYAGFLVAAGAAVSAAGIECLTRELGLLGSRVQRWTAFGMAGIVLGGNTLLFLLGWPGAGRLAQRSLSNVEIRDHDRYYQELGAFLRGRHAPGTVRILCSWNSTDGLRVAGYLLPEYAGDIAQPVGEIPTLHPSLVPLSFLRLMTPAQVRAEGRPAYLIVRTREDPGYHGSLFQEGWEEVPIGPGHVVYQLQ